METQEGLPLPTGDMKEELRRTVHHLTRMLRTVKWASPNSPAAAVSTALELHLKKLTPAELGLPEVWEEHAARIEAQALEDAHALDGSAKHTRTA